MECSKMRGKLLVAALAIEIGLTSQQVEAGIAKTQPFEHRMQPRRVGGALIIDDTYNGNLEGVRAGVALLRELPAQRKWYVTPGLVDQGKDTAAIHRQMGELIASAKPEIVVLMDNSARPYIWEGLQAADFRGEMRIESDPLSFYTNIHLFVAAGDVVLMQNDWTDNYE
jgi:UDP-N-acetylmuramyl pentapeptide synthase